MLVGDLLCELVTRHKKGGVLAGSFYAYVSNPPDGSPEQTRIIMATPLYTPQGKKACDVLLKMAVALRVIGLLKASERRSLWRRIREARDKDGEPIPVN